MRNKLLSIATLALAVAGCSAAAGAPAPQAAAATPIIIYVTPAPTVEPTPTPDPTPTPTPRPTPTPEPVAADGWPEFLVHTSAIATTCDIEPFRSALNYAVLDDGVSAYSEGLDLASCVSDEVDWFDAHQPSACYETLWGKVRGFYLELGKGLDYWNQWLYDYPYPSQRDMDRGSTHVTEATSDLEEVNILLERANDNGSFCMVAAKLTST